jgi:hypothetical protein
MTGSGELRVRAPEQGIGTAKVYRNFRMKGGSALGWCFVGCEEGRELCVGETCKCDKSAVFFKGPMNWFYWNRIRFCCLQGFKTHSDLFISTGILFHSPDETPLATPPPFGSDYRPLPHTDHRPHTILPISASHITRAACCKPLADKHSKRMRNCSRSAACFFCPFRQVSATFPRFRSSRGGGVAVENRYCETAVAAAFRPPTATGPVTNLPPPLRPNHPSHLASSRRAAAAARRRARVAPYRTSKACRRAHFLTFHNSCHSLCCSAIL